MKVWDLIEICEVEVAIGEDFVMTHGLLLLISGMYIKKKLSSPFSSPYSQPNWEEGNPKNFSPKFPLIWEVITTKFFKKQNQFLDQISPLFSTLILTTSSSLSLVCADTSSRRSTRASVHWAVGGQMVGGGEGVFLTYFLWIPLKVYQSSKLMWL